MDNSKLKLFWTLSVDVGFPLARFQVMFEFIQGLTFSIAFNL